MNDPIAKLKAEDSVVSLESQCGSQAYLTCKTQDEEDYDIQAARDQEKGQSSGGALMHFLKASLGTGILAMPMAFANAGLVFGLIGTVLVGLLCTHCVHILVNTSQKMCRKLRIPYMSYAETTLNVFEHGPVKLRPWANFARQFVDGSMMATYYASACVYMVFVSTSFHDVINYRTGLEWSIRIYIAITLVAFLLLGQIRDLKWLVPFSACANLFIVITFSITLYFMFKVPLTYADKALVVPVSKWPVFFSTVVFAMEGIGVVMPVENGMKKPQQFLGCPSVLSIAMTFIIAMFAAIGFFGYVCFGDDVKGSITLNLPNGNVLADVAKLLMAVAILFTYALQFFVPNDILWGKIKQKFRPENHNRWHITMRTCIILVSAGIAAAIPDLGPFISLVGAVFFSLLGIFIPSFVETVFLWPHHFGWLKWKLMKNIIVMILSMLALVSGALVSIQDIIAQYA